MWRRKEQTPDGSRGAHDLLFLHAARATESSREVLRKPDNWSGEWLAECGAHLPPSKEKDDTCDSAAVARCFGRGRGHVNPNRSCYDLSQSLVVCQVLGCVLTEIGLVFFADRTP